MFWLIWQMGVLLVIVFGFGLLVGYFVWSGNARSAEADQMQADNARLRQENENLARRVGEATARTVTPAEDAPQIAPAAPATPDAGIDRGPAPGAPEPAAKPAKKAAPSKPSPKPTAKAEPKPAPKSPAKTAAKSAAKPATKAAAASPAGGDDLTRIKGLGPKAEAALKAGGVTTLAQIAGWSDSDVETWDARINGRGRIARDNWVGQAKDLAG